MKIYTKKGDKGETSLWNGKRVKKSSSTIRVLGEMDELTVRIGNLAVYIPGNKLLRRMQSEIQNINTHVATPTKISRGLPALDKLLVKDMEREIDEMTSALPKLTVFIIPCQSPVDSLVHLCRTQARKAETHLVDESLSRFEEDGLEELDSTALETINRMSDYFFTLSRHIVANPQSTSHLVN